MGVTLMKVDLACDQQFHKQLGPSATFLRAQAKGFRTRAISGLVQKSSGSQTVRTLALPALNKTGLAETNSADSQETHY